MDTNQNNILSLMIIIKKIANSTDLGRDLGLQYDFADIFGKYFQQVFANVGPIYLRGNVNTPNSVRIIITGTNLNVQNTLDGITWEDIETVASPV